MDIPQINTVGPDGHLHAKDMLNLPSDTPLGNLLLKELKIHYRIRRVNELLTQVYNLYLSDRPSILTPYCVLPIEEIVYHLRKVTDELICLYDFLNYYEQKGKYRTEIEVDSIGKLLKEESISKDEPFSPHVAFLNSINEISNAYKHSFIQTDVNLVGAHEPRVYALALKQNNLKSTPKLHDYALRDIVGQFSQFHLGMNLWLKGFYCRVTNNTA